MYGRNSMREHYKQIKNFCLLHNIRVLNLIKILEIEAGEKLFAFDTHMLAEGWAVPDKNKEHLILTDKAKTLLSTLQYTSAPVPTVVKTTVKYHLPKLSADTGVFVKTLAENLLPGRYTKEELTKVEKYCENPWNLPFLFLFLELFPTADKQKNANWEKLFSAEYDGVTLRKISAGTAKKFERIIKTRDVGIFLAGTYQHILESYSGKNGKYYPKAIENYFKEWEHWYDNASVKISKAVSKRKEQEISNMTII